MEESGPPFYLKVIIILESVGFILFVFGSIIGIITGFYTLMKIGGYMIIGGLVLWAILYIFSELR